MGVLRQLYSFSPSFEATQLISPHEGELSNRQLDFRLWRSHRIAGQDKRIAAGVAAAFAAIAIGAAAYKSPIAAGAGLGVAAAFAPLVHRHRKREMFLKFQIDYMRHHGMEKARKNLSAIANS